MPSPDVTLIAPYPPAGERHGGHSGVASYTANLAHGLARGGLTVHVVAAELDGDPTHFHDGPVAVHRAFRFGPGALPGAARAAQALGAPVTHLQWELFLYGGPPSIPGLFPALRRLSPRHRGRDPLVVTLHQVVDPSEIDRRYMRLHRVKAPAPLARAGMAGVQYAVRQAAAATIVHEEPFRRIIPDAAVIPHGVERVRAGERDAARRALNLDGRLTVVCFGFVAPYKGLEAVLDAAGLVTDEVQIVVAGGEHPRMTSDGFSQDLRARYGKAARFTGWVPDADVGHWFAAADVALFPYPKPFASSGALALALAYRTPILMSAALARCVGAPADLAAPTDPPALADRLRRLASPGGRAELARLAEWTATLAAGRTWDAVAQRHADLYQEVIDADRVARGRLRAG
jgi:glycosyltransferase involved in cell wall biosynthesis